MPTQARFAFPATATRAALLIVDMQRVFLEPGSPLCVPGGLALIPGLNALAARCRRLGVPVLYSATEHAGDGSDLGLIPEGLAPWRAAVPFLTDKAWQALHPELERQGEEPLFAKTRYSVFYRTGLHEWLVARGRDVLIIGGVATTACCAATARDAYFRDIRPIVLADACATYGLPDMGHGAYGPELAHAVVLADLARHCARVVASGVVADELRASAT